MVTAQEDATATPEAAADEAEAQADEPETLPQTGGSTTPWLAMTLTALGLAVVVGSFLIMRRQAGEQR